MQFRDLPEDLQASLSPLFDPENPLSLANKLPAPIPGVLLKLVTEDLRLPHLLADEEELLSHVLAEKGWHPTVTDHRIRLLFWNEFENAIFEGRMMVPNNIHSIVCNAKAFQMFFLKQSHRAAFLLCKPGAYQVALRETLMHGMKQLRRILDIPEIDAKGKLNVPLLKLKAQITSMVDLRLHGAPTQKIHQVTQNLPVSGASTLPNAAEIQALAKKGDLKTLQNRLSEIAAQQRELEGGTEAPAPLEAELVPAKRE